MSNGGDAKERMVSGYYFDNEWEARKARQEADGVKFIRSRTDMNDPEMVLRIYNRMIKQNMFETQIGIAYLRELQKYLYSIPYIEKKAILPIRVVHPMLEDYYRRSERIRSRNAAPAPQKTVVHTDFKKRYRVMVWVCLGLVICIIAMFIITGTSGNATILNYETNLINKYESWEQELNEREQAITLREQELGQ